MTHNPPTSQPDLDAIQARIDAASPGPWTESGIGDYGWGVGSPAEHIVEADDSEQGRANAAFIAHARTDVEQLVAEVRRLRAQVAAVTALHEKGEHNGLDICLECASQMFPPPETGIWSESAWPCATLRALGVDDEQPAVRPAVETGA